MRARGCPTPWIAALALSVLASPAMTAPVSRHVRAQLVSEMESIRPGQPFWAGLRLQMDPEWHTYWRNPGDSGLATRLVWSLPPGFSAGPIQWPYPRAFTQGPVTSYGYDGEVLLPVAITPPTSLAEGTSVTLAARADWLECREACVPGRSELTLVLPVRGEAPRPSSAWASAFAEARGRLPAEAVGWRFEVAERAAKLALAIHPPRAEGELRKAAFFPGSPHALDHAAAQPLTRVASGYVLELTPDPNAARPREKVKGVLVVETAGGTRAVQVEER